MFYKDNFIIFLSFYPSQEPNHKLKKKCSKISEEEWSGFFFSKCMAFKTKKIRKKNR